MFLDFVVIQLYHMNMLKHVNELCLMLE